MAYTRVVQVDRLSLMHIGEDEGGGCPTVVPLTEVLDTHRTPTPPTVEAKPRENAAAHRVKEGSTARRVERGPAPHTVQMLQALEHSLVQWRAAHYT